MKKRIISSLLAAMFIMGNFTAVNAESKILAFPGAEGGGMFASGGRGGEVYVVTTLADYDPETEMPIEGTFRDAVSKDNRIVVFNVSGVIDLKAPMRIHGKNITIAGQSAPGNGITLYGYETNMSLAENVILRYMRFRPGAKNVHRGDSMDALWGRGMKNMIVDHVSASWSTDETLSLYRAENMTVQWSIISESLAMSGHTKGRHGYGAIWGGVNTTYHHNLIANHTSRNPRMGGGTPEADDNDHIANFDIRNNVIYNWGFNTCYGGGRANTNFVYNYEKPGPGTRDEVRDRVIDCGEKNKPGGFYVFGNVLEGNKEVSEDNSKGIYIAEDAKEFTTIADKEFDVEAAKHVHTDTPEQAYKLVLAKAGAVYPKRDALDARIIAEVKNDTGRFSNLDEQVGGLPFTEEIHRPEDFDKDLDGIADEWELAHGLDPKDKSDSRLLCQDMSGYTNIEVYLNSLVDMNYAPQNPSVMLSRPANNDIYTLGDSVKMTAVVSEDVEKVEFYNGAEIISVDEEAPFEAELKGLADGTYFISAKAFSSNGLQTQSDANAIHINTYDLKGWSQRNIGAPAVKGNASGDGVYTVKGSGKIGDKADSCYFMYRTLVGDGEISAKIDSITAVDNHAFSGLMIRESLNSDAKTIALGLSHTKPYEWKETDPQTGKSTTYYRNAFGIYMVGRYTTGGVFDQIAEDLDSLDKAKAANVALKNDIPFKDKGEFLGYYVKLRREGDTFISYTSKDGKEWEELAKRTVKMGERVYMGIAVDGNKVNNKLDNLNTAKFSDVVYEGGQSAAEKFSWKDKKQ
ncbi:MAG: hypothetical protein IJ062_08805 [Firmicutes bacterium]|nr:hypothetical protein [Bacillota bacterium]